jgi:lia operon protein LiaF
MKKGSWQLFWGAVLILCGALFLVSNLNLVPFSIGDVFRYGWPLFLVALGVLILAGAFGWRGWSWAPGAGVGDRRVNFSGKEVRDLQLSHGLGDFEMDFASAVFPEGTAHVRASHGLGDLKIWVPKDLPVRVTARAGLGDVKVFGQKDDGFGPHLDYTSPDYATATRKLDLEASVGLGEVNVRQVG